MAGSQHGGSGQPRQVDPVSAVRMGDEHDRRDARHLHAGRSARHGEHEPAVRCGIERGGGPVSATGNAILGGNSATIDFTTLASAGLWMGVTHATSTTNTWVPQFVGWGSWS
jgi:hypothetical protein